MDWTKPINSKSKSWRDKEEETKQKQIARATKASDERNGKREKNLKNAYEHLDENTKEKVDFIAKEEGVHPTVAYDVYQNMSASEKRTYTKLMNEQKKTAEGKYATPKSPIAKNEEERFKYVTNKKEKSIFVAISDHFAEYGDEPTGYRKTDIKLIDLYNRYVEYGDSRDLKEISKVIYSLTGNHRFLW